MDKHKHLVARLLAGAGRLLALCALSAAFWPAAAYAQNVPQGYQSDQSLQNGMIVRLKQGDGTRVQAVTQQDAQEMFGVVVSASDAAVSLSHTSATQETYVANAGQYDVLVSNQNGVIKAGDYLTISALAGVGMKAGANEQFVLGKALTNFDGKTNVETTATLQTSSGQKTVNLGRVTVDVSVAHNPNYSKQDQNGVPHIFQSLAQVVTDKPVAPFRIYAGLAILVACVIIAGIILYAGVRTGMTAVGRNPLAKKSITRNLFEVILTALIVFVIGLIAVYLLLRI